MIYTLNGDSKIIFNEEVYDLGITEVLRQNGQVYDEYILEDGQAKIIRRINSQFLHLIWYYFVHHLKHFEYLY